MKIFYRLILGIFLIFSIFGRLNARSVYAQKCDNRFVTLVNPVRGRNLWIDKSLTPLIAQYNLIQSLGFSATWLLQYDALKDPELLTEIRNFKQDQELGVFLEISPQLASDARVIYPFAVAWDDPNAIFLSGYSQSERRLLISKLFEEFKVKFGYFPKSVGAWWIDSYSLDYMVKKYGIRIGLIVADQKTTDDYGVWGQWWGIPYYPSKANVLVPASNGKNAQNVVVIQWAQRDLSQAYGEGIEFSNYSLQANDYTAKGLETVYFNDLADKYLSCNLPLGQITVGLETGIESVKSFSEYQNQLGTLKRNRNLEPVTMSEFAVKFKSQNKSNLSEIKLVDEKSVWVLTPRQRKNEFLGELINYNPEIAFSDFFVADKNKFLDRRLESQTKNLNNKNHFPWFAVVFLGWGIVFYKKRMFNFFIPLSLFILSSYFLVFRSFEKFGWQVYFGPVFKNNEFTKLILVFGSLLAFFIFANSIPKEKLGKLKLFVWFLPLSFSLDAILYFARYTYMSGKHFLGLAPDALRFTGLSFSKTEIGFINKDFPAVQAASLIRFPFNDIWSNRLLSVIGYPLIHLLLAFILWLVLKNLNKRVRTLILLIMFVFFLLYWLFILKIDPRIAVSAVE